MSQYPPPYPGQPEGYPQTPNYYSGGGVFVNPRPTSVTVLAVLGIILGSLTVLCSGPGLVMNVIMLPTGRNPFAPQMPPMSHSLVLFSIVQCVLNLGLALTLLICSIAALYLKPFARRVLMPWSAIMLVWTVALFIVQLLWLRPAMERASQRLTASAPNAAMVASIQHASYLAGAVLTCVVMASLPICFLIFWNRPHVKAAFGGSSSQQPAPYPPPWQPS